jgi:hypothetical protein
MERPKPGPSASSSDDLDRARAASQRLKGQAGARVTEPGYVTFARAPAQAAKPAEVPRPRPSMVPLVTRREPLKGPNAGFGAGAWNKLLDACVQIAVAEAAFLMDPQGLMVAVRGPAASQELEAVGARLMLAFEQADLVGGAEQAALSLSVELTRGTLHGLRLVQPEGVLLLGLIIPGGLTAERQERLQALLHAAQ